MNLKITLDTDRVDSLVEEFRQRAAQVEGFVKEKLANLNNSEPGILAFLEEVDGLNIRFGNMYSTGHSDNTYTGDNFLLVHCVLSLKKGYINKILLAKKLTAAWKSKIPFGAEFTDYNIRDMESTYSNPAKTEVKFQIWVK